MNYGCHTAINTELQTLVELLVADLGLSFQLFQLPYGHYSEWFTTCWLKRIREIVGHFGFALLVHNLLSTFPRDGDSWLIAWFIVTGFKGTDLLILNR